MFCHGWQNKASRATDGSLNAGHVTPRKSNSDTLRLFLFSYNGTKINSGFAQNAIHRPTTHHLDGRRMSTTNQHLADSSCLFFYAKIDVPTSNLMIVHLFSYVNYIFNTLTSALMPALLLLTEWQVSHLSFVHTIRQPHFPKRHIF